MFRENIESHHPPLRQPPQKFGRRPSRTTTSVEYRFVALQREGFRPRRPKGFAANYFSSQSINRPGVHGAPAASIARSKFPRSVWIKPFSLEDCTASSCDAIV